MDLLGRARGFFKGLSTPPVARVQYYNVICPEGHRVRGQRTEGYQALRCPACGEGVFVLPASPLPEPEPPPKTASRRRAARQPLDVDAPLELKDPGQVTVEVVDPDDRIVDAEIEWEDEVSGDSPGADAASAEPTAPGVSPRDDAARPEETHPRKPRKRREALAADQAQTSPPRPEKSAPQPQGNVRPGSTGVRPRQPQPEPEPESEFTSGIPRRAFRTGNRPAMVIAALVLLAVGAIALRTWRTRRHMLPEVASVGRNEGIPALEEGKFDKAYQLLSRARDAVDTLGDDVEGAEEIRHAADEASVFVDLLTDSLEHLLEEAARARPQEWETRFGDLYKGRSVIIQATVISAPASGGSGRYELDYVILPPGEGAGERRFARVDISDLEALTLAQPKPGDHVVFGARLASFQYDTDQESFVIRFEPKSGVAIRYHKALEALGWPTGALIPNETSAGAVEQ